MFPARAFWPRARSSTLDQITEKGPIIAGGVAATGGVVKPDQQAAVSDAEHEAGRQLRGKRRLRLILDPGEGIECSRRSRPFRITCAYLATTSISTAAPSGRPAA